MVHFQQVHFKREQRTILSDINLQMKKGENWVILGKNGSGKTTMLEMMNGYLFPSSGRIKVLKYTYGECDVREVRKEIGYISQSLFEKFTLHDPVWEIVATGEYAFLRFYQDIPAEVIDKADAMLERFRILHLRNQPLGTLSQGERKKLMLARSLMSSPRLIIMDEPCSGLDLYEREKLLESMQSLSESDLQIIYVTHHIEEIIPIFTHVALIESGRIVAAGAKENVLTPEHLEETFQVRLAVDWYEGRPWIKVKSN